MNRIAFKLAASSAIVSMTMLAASSSLAAMRGFEVGRRASGASDRQAAQLHQQASRALQQGQLGQAIDLMEQAVSLSPRDVGYRMLLADAYLKAGRLDSARATYGDVVSLDPSNVRGGLSIALIQIAQGRPQAAIGLLDDLSGRAPDADVGLAYALAGASERAIAVLEPAARAATATPRVRQNLALAYAISGDWRRARAVAAQDVSPSDLDQRMTQWAAFARPGAGATQVASMLGVTPVQDAGQPVRLALAPEVAPETALVEAAPAPAPVPEAAPVQTFAEAAPAPAPVQVAAAEAPAPVWVPTAQSWQAAPAPAPAAPTAPVLAEAPVPAAPAPEVQARFADASRSLATQQPALRRASFTPTAAPVFQRAAPGPAVRSGSAPVVVQLGAFSNEANAERAWVQASQRFALEGRNPLTTTINLNGRTLHRVSVSGFASAADASRLCGAIRGQGGSCFVRGQAGDASIRWAARYANGRNRNA